MNNSEHNTVLRTIKFSCNQCDAKFVKASGLKSHHERTKHSNKTPITITANVETNERVCNDPEIFKCGSCYLTFKTENALKAHEITHTKAAPFTITTNLDTIWMKSGTKGCAKMVCSTKMASGCPKTD